MKLLKRPGLMAQKLGMTRLYLDTRCVPVTLLDMSSACVLEAHHEKDQGYWTVHVGSQALKPKHVNKPLEGYFKKVGADARGQRKVFRVTEPWSAGILQKNHSASHAQTAEEGDVETSAQTDVCNWHTGQIFSPEYFPVGSLLDVTGYTIGRGFAGPMKRHNFGGLRASHGVSVSHRSHGSTGNRKSPARTFKNKKMAGHMGCVRVTVQNLRVMDVDAERGLLVVQGNVPGHESGWVMVRDAVKHTPRTCVYFDRPFAHMKN